MRCYALIVWMGLWLAAAGYREMYLQGSEICSPLPCKFGINLKSVVLHWCAARLIEGKMISICRHDANTERRVKFPFVQEV